MDAVDRDLKLVGLERKMADDKSLETMAKTIDDNCGDDDHDGTSRRKIYQNQNQNKNFIYLNHINAIFKHDY